MISELPLQKYFILNFQSRERETVNFGKSGALSVEMVKSCCQKAFLMLSSRLSHRVIALY